MRHLMAFDNTALRFLFAVMTQMNPPAFLYPEDSNNLACSRFDESCLFKANREATKALVRSTTVAYCVSCTYYCTETKLGRNSSGPASLTSGSFLSLFSVLRAVGRASSWMVASVPFRPWANNDRWCSYQLLRQGTSSGIRERSSSADSSGGSVV